MHDDLLEQLEHGPLYRFADQARLGSSRRSRLRRSVTHACRWMLWFAKRSTGLCFSLRCGLGLRHCAPDRNRHQERWTESRSTASEPIAPSFALTEPQAGAVHSACRPDCDLGSNFLGGCGYPPAQGSAMFANGSRPYTRFKRAASCASRAPGVASLSHAFHATSSWCASESCQM